MKAYWKYLLCAAFSFGALTACEDVPEPYNIPTDNGGGNTGGNTTTIDYVANQDFTRGLGEFLTTSASGNLAWEYSAKYGAMISGYQDWDGSGQKSNKPGVTYLVSPEYDLTNCDSAYVVINQAINYAKSTLDSDHKLMIHVGEDGEWAELPMNLDGLGNDFNYATQYIQIPDAYMGQKVQLGLKHTAHEDYSSTWEVKNLGVAKGTAPSSDAPVSEDGVGSGTADDPYDVPTTIKLIAAGAPTAKIYTKGIVSKIDEIDTGSYGNATYYISNDGTTTDQLEVYRGYGLGGAKFKSTDDLKVGDEVIVYGQVVYYNNRTMEFTQGSQIYSLNGVTSGGGSGEVSGDAKGAGTEEDPYNVAAAAAASGNAWVTGYIVGWVDGQVLSSGANFNGSSSVATNLLIADNANETNVANCMPVQLPAGEVRSALNLKDNPANYKKLVKLYGSLEKYFGTAGLKSVSAYSLDGATGGSGDDNNQPAGEAKGSGTLADPYNSVAAVNIANGLAADQSTDQAYYIKGKVVSVKEQFAAQNGNVTCFISDDGTTAGQFQVFRALYLGNRKWVAGDATLKAGDEIVVYAKITNYKGNTPETAAGKEGQADGYIYSINGSTDGTTDNTGGDNGGDDDDTAGIAFSAFANGDFEAWTGGQPDGWKSASSASNATLSQSTDAHGGSYSVCVGGATSGNKRLAYQEMALEPGTYTCSFWTKAATSAEASLCPGHAVIGSNITYNYDKGDDGKNRYVNNIGSEWQQVTYSFTISAKSSVCLIIMNSKTTGTDLLVDDFTIVKQ